MPNGSNRSNICKNKMHEKKFERKLIVYLLLKCATVRFYSVSRNDSNHARFK